MLGSARSTRGRLAAGLSVVLAFVLASCSETPVTPGSEMFRQTGAPQAAFSSVFDDFDFLGFLEDDGGVNDVPAQSDLNAFTRADNLVPSEGRVGVQFVWDNVDEWGGAGQTGDACALFDTTDPNASSPKGKGLANFAVCVRITNPDGNTSQTVQLSPGSPLLYSCGDSKNDRCASKTALLDIDGIVCEVERRAGETFFNGAGEDNADVYAACSIPLSAFNTAQTPNLINVCSFPSGSPNSNPFDCVVTPGAGFIIIKKTTTPQNSGATFNFTISPAPIGGGSKSLTDNTANDEETALLSAAPGTNYSITEGTLPAGWSFHSASCVLDLPTPVATGSATTQGRSSVEVRSGETTICTFDNRVLAPSISVVKTATTPTVPETGGNASYSVLVTNNSVIDVTLASLIDDKFGDLDGQGTCNSASDPTNPYGTLAASGGTYSCTFTGAIGAGNAGGTHINEVTASVSSAGGPATAKDTAKVTYSDVLPDISVTKIADKSSITANGGSLSTFGDAQFARNGGGGGGGSTPIFANDTCDDLGPNDEPAQVDLNCFSRADNVTGYLGLRWTWDSKSQWTGSGQTGDACALLDTDNNSNANFSLCVRITNPGGDPNVVAQVEGSPILYKCKDTAPDRCPALSGGPNANQPITLHATSGCSVSEVDEHFQDPQEGVGDDGVDVQALCSLRLQDLGQNVSIANLDLLNVCSFPSGSPNSNPFDCVVQVAAGFLVITKSTTPSNSDSYFGYTLRNSANSANATATNGDDEWAVQGGASSAGIPILPGTYALTEVLPTNWSLNSISCTRDGNNVGTTSGNTRLNLTIVSGQTTTCTFTNSLSASDDVEFTVTVTNNGAEAVSLTSLHDREWTGTTEPSTEASFVSLSGVGTCNSAANAFGTIAASGGTYVCKFTRTISGSPGFSHKDRVRAQASDNDSNTDTETSSIVTVTIN